ncbi:cupin domain-containing protein [Bacillus sp. KH172YL63]|uniref:cupin domain-containing protein n=1 Tax=Bacillus sp. KH172YL63 TaxID=2709784 RepID=UPI0013E4B804|nr:cupin [Bacillus sp. KH172YL63]BCB02225.1 cupin [Bacillus sp. KH172YL63]
MKIYSFHQQTGKSIGQFNSQNVTIHPLLKPDESFQIGYFYLEANSVLGMHPAMCDQLLMVTSGRGWVRVEGEERVMVGPGTAIYWEKGEMHESGSDEGMTAVVAEGGKLDPERYLPVR